VYSAPRQTGILTAEVPFAIVKFDVDDRIKQLLRDLGTAINESISGSDDVNKQIQKIREEGYNLYVVLDATIGLNRQEEGEVPAEVVAVKSSKDVQFRININDLALLRSLGIDPTRKVRTTRRIEPISTPSDEQ
jgi:adenylate cyclase